MDKYKIKLEQYILHIKNGDMINQLSVDCFDDMLTNMYIIDNMSWGDTSHLYTTKLLYNLGDEYEVHRLNVIRKDVYKKLRMMGIIQ